MASLIFSDPQYLFLFLIIPVVIFFHFATITIAHNRALRFANFPAIQRVTGIDFFSKNLVQLGLTCLIISLFILALSGARLQREELGSTSSFVLAIDNSNSMEALDFSPNRLEAAKRFASQFVDSSSADTRIGLLSFSGNAYIENDLTDNKNTLKDALKRIHLSGVSGTDVYEAVLTSSNLLKKEEARSIILLSDGQLNIGNITDIVDYATKNEVVINTIAVGTVEGGKTSYGLSKLDEDALKYLAFNTGGVYARATDEQTLSNAFSDALHLRRRRVRQDISKQLILGTLFLFILYYVLSNTRYRRIP